MVRARIDHIRVGDNTIVFRFYEINRELGLEKEVGSRGVNAGKDFDSAIFDEVMNMTLREYVEAMTEGFEITEKPSKAIEKIAKIAYEQFVKAKQAEESKIEIKIEQKTTPETMPESSETVT